MLNKVNVVSFVQQAMDLFPGDIMVIPPFTVGAALFSSVISLKEFCKRNVELLSIGKTRIRTFLLEYLQVIKYVPARYLDHGK